MHILNSIDHYFRTWLSNELTLSDLKENDLHRFFLENNEISNIDKDPKNLKATDFIHFIWMGNPLKEEYKKNILSWKKRYPDKKLIIWVDQNALSHKDLIDFAIKNNIKLIDIEKVFNDKNALGLNEFINLEKNRLPPNWAAASDMYRYLIMNYFGGTYSDTDVDVNIKLNNDEIDFDSDMVFCNDFNFNNDFLMTKNIKEDFWFSFIEEIKDNYNNNDSYQTKRFNRYSEDLYSRKRATLWRAGPGSLGEFIDKYGLKNLKKVKHLNDETMVTLSWLGKLTDEKCQSLATQKGIEERIINNIVIDLKESDSLDLTKYDCIIDKIPDVKREDIIQKLEVKIKELDEKDYKIENIFAKNKKEYEKFLSIISLKNQKIQSYNRAFRKAAQRKHPEMLEYLNNEHPDEIFIQNRLLSKITSVVMNMDKEIMLSILKRAKEQGKSIELDLNTAIIFFEKLPKELIKEYISLLTFDNRSFLFDFIEDIYGNESSLIDENEFQIKNDQFIKLLNLLPEELLLYKNILGFNFLFKLCQIANINHISKIKNIIIQRDKSLWNRLVDDVIGLNRPLKDDIKELIVS